MADPNGATAVNFGFKNVERHQISVFVTGSISLNTRFSERELNLGVPKKGSSFSRELDVSNISIREDFHIESEDTDSLDVSIKNGAERGQFRVQVRGVIDGQEGGKYREIIKFKTNDPHEPSVSLKVFAAIPKVSCCQ